MGDVRADAPEVPKLLLTAEQLEKAKQRKLAKAYGVIEEVYKTENTFRESMNNLCIAFETYKHLFKESDQKKFAMFLDPYKKLCETDQFAQQFNQLKAVVATGYDLEPMLKPEQKRQPGKIYIDTNDPAQLSYEIIGMDGELKEGKIPWKDLEGEGLFKEVFPRKVSELMGINYVKKRILLTHISNANADHIRLDKLDPIAVRSAIANFMFMTDPAAWDAFGSAIVNHADFDQFVKNLNEKYEEAFNSMEESKRGISKENKLLKGLTVKDHVIMPVQRPPRYALLIRDLQDAIKYDLGLKSDLMAEAKRNNKPANYKPGKIYIDTGTNGTGLSYEVIGLDGKLKIGEILWGDLSDFPKNASEIEELKENNRKQYDEFMDILFKVTSNAGHTDLDFISLDQSSQLSNVVKLHADRANEMVREKENYDQLKKLIKDTITQFEKTLDKKSPIKTHLQKMLNEIEVCQYQSESNNLHALPLEVLYANLSIILNNLRRSLLDQKNNPSVVKLLSELDAHVEKSDAFKSLDVKVKEDIQASSSYVPSPSGIVRVPKLAELTSRKNVIEKTIKDNTSSPSVAKSALLVEENKVRAYYDVMTKKVDSNIERIEGKISGLKSKIRFEKNKDSIKNLKKTLVKEKLARKEEIAERRNLQKRKGEVLKLYKNANDKLDKIADKIDKSSKKLLKITAPKSNMNPPLPATPPPKNITPSLPTTPPPKAMPASVLSGGLFNKGVPKKVLKKSSSFLETHKKALALGEHRGAKSKEMPSVTEEQVEAEVKVTPKITNRK